VFGILSRITRVNMQAYTKPIRPITTFIANLHGADIILKPVIRMGLQVK
jgi:hypothetical protein